MVSYNLQAKPFQNHFQNSKISIKGIINSNSQLSAQIQKNLRKFQHEGNEKTSTIAAKHFSFFFTDLVMVSNRSELIFIAIEAKIFQNFITTKTMSFNPAEYASAYVTVDEVLQIKKAFDLFDRDLGGAIDPKELKVAINSLGIEAQAQAVYQMIAEIDKDGSGQIDFSEFFEMMTTRPSDNESREEVHKVFITFDPEKTGYIALKNLRKVAKDLGELTDDNTLQEMIDRADADQDTVVSEEEFYNLITKKAH